MVEVDKFMLKFDLFKIVKNKPGCLLVKKGFYGHFQSRGSYMQYITCQTYLTFKYIKTWSTQLETDTE